MMIRLVLFDLVLGVTALLALGILDHIQKNKSRSLLEMEHNSSEYLHTLIEALRLAFAGAPFSVNIAFISL